MIFFFSRCLTVLLGNIPEIFQLLLGSGQLKSEKSLIFLLYHRAESFQCS